MEWVSLEHWGDLPEPRETGESFAANARIKATYYSRATGRWALAEDSGLEVDALGKAPGVRSARYAADECAADGDRATIDRANNRRLLEQLAGVPSERRTARFVCHVALADGERIVLEASGAVEGRIAQEPRGSNGFGYDPLFWLDELGCTSAELTPQRKNEISHRGNALRKFGELLRRMLEANG